MNADPEILYRVTVAGRRDNRQREIRRGGYDTCIAVFEAAIVCPLYSRVELRRESGELVGVGAQRTGAVRVA